MKTLLSIVCIAVWSAAAGAAAPDEFRVKRQEVFAFTRKPQVSHRGDKVAIAFAVKGYCDVTLAIEDAKGRIVRHLASGVLGEGAPPPFRKRSLAQTVVWDGKNDQGKYIDDLAGHSVRVSLGLKPRFERSLMWIPKRRASKQPPQMAAAPEGVYVYDGGNGLDELILFDHDGGYVRTVYPFPPGKLAETRGLAWHTFVQDGRRLPLKTNFLQCTMLTSGRNAWNLQTFDAKRDVYKSVVGTNTAHFGMFGGAASAMDLRAGRIALVHKRLNRLGTDGTTAGLPLGGPKTFITVRATRHYVDTPSPGSAALSPDGRRLYLTGYIMRRIQRASQDIQKLADCRGVPVVLRLDMESNDPPTVFAGGLKLSDDGAAAGRFKSPTSVATDAKGRVYVGDYINDRVQVFSAGGKHLKSIAAYRPAHVDVHRRSGEIWVFSWRVRNLYDDTHVRRQVVRYGPFENPKKLATYELAGQGRFATSWGASSPVEFVAELDSWADPPRIWIAEPWTGANVLNRGRITRSSVQVLEVRDGRLKVVRDFAAEARAAGVAPADPMYYRQRLIVDHKTGRLYVAEGDNSAIGKSFRELIEIDPATGKLKRRQLPFDAEDMCFDLDGVAYLRTVNVVARYLPAGWREIPWDYGEERRRVGFGWMSSTRTASLVGVLVMPSDGNWHHGGMFVSPKRHLAVGCLYNVTMQVRTAAKYVHRGKKYTPKLYPGRLFGGRGGTSCIHVWDRHGTLLREDAVPGLSDLYGVGIDADGDLYLMSAATRVLDGKPYYNDMTGTLMKFKRGRGRVLTSKKKIHLPLSETEYPKRPPDVVSAMQGSAWVTDAEWMYGGVGFGGKNRGTGCACWNFRATLDYFARSFAPEMDRYSVAVLDKAGNLICRIGAYGSVDDGLPLIRDGGPPKPRSLGGDEVALFHGAYLATHTDRRLFIADPGNGRILSVRLDYHATEKIPLKAPSRSTP